jgi:hypothetical protein
MSGEGQQTQGGEQQQGGGGEQQQQQQQQQSAIVDHAPYYATLSDDNKVAFAGRKFEAAKTTANDLLDVIRGQDKLIGRNNLEQPNLSDDKALAAWPGFKALGVPDKAEEYKLARPETLPDGMQWDENAEKLARNVLLKAKVPAKFAQAAFDELVNDRITQFSAAKSAREEAARDMDASLARDWGAQKDANIAEAKRGAAVLAEKAGVQLDAGALADVMAGLYGNAGAIKVLHYIAKSNAEDSIRGGGQPSGDPNTPEGAKAQIGVLEADSDFMKAYTQADNPGHAAAVKRYSRLMQLANPNPKQ